MPKRVLPRADAALVRRSSADQAALYIRRLIFDRDLRPGDRVPQDEVARTLGISRIPVREALIALEREGWVNIELHRGAFINAIDVQAVRDHYELYGLVYGFAARRAFGRNNPTLIERLTDLNERIAASDDAEELGQLSIEFHAAVVDAAHSPRIKVVLRAMPALIPGAFFSEVPDAIDIQRRGTTAILRAASRGDVARAADEYLRVMKKIGDKVVQVFKERGLFSSSDAAA
jgi:DNA-binding GntR family transcriptional regulator